MGPALIAEILELHVDEAGFLWRIRDGAAVAPHYDRASLGDLDERLDAHLDGLRIAGPEGVELAVKALDPEEPGTAFTAAVLAAEQGDTESLDAVVDAASADRALGRAVVSGLAWLSFEEARQRITPLMAAKESPARRRIGIAASAAHRQDPGEALFYAILDDDPALRARGMRAAGELARADAVEALRAEIGRRAVDALGFWAAWSGALLGIEAATAALWTIADAGGPFAERACAMAMRRLDVREGRARLETLGAAADHARTAVAGAGALGDPALVPWLLAAMATPALARVAGEAFATITGAVIEGRLEGAAPEGFEAGPTDRAADEGVAMDPDWQLRWPAPEALAAWWSAHGGGLRRGSRYLGGVALTPEAAERQLARGSQRRRAGAAIELALLRPGKPLAEVRARRRLTPR